MGNTRPEPHTPIGHDTVGDEPEHERRRPGRAREEKHVEPRRDGREMGRAATRRNPSCRARTAPRYRRARRPGRARATRPFLGLAEVRTCR
jgi:hypothetical protein